MSDIKRAYTLFHDEKRTVQFLNEYSKEFLYNEIGDSEDEDDEGEEAGTSGTGADKMETS